MAQLILRHNLNHDGEWYEHDTVWEPPTVKQVYDRKAKEFKEVPMSETEREKLTADLIANGTLVPEDQLQPKVVIDHQAAEIERLNAELEELKAKMGVPERLGSGGKVSK